MSEISFDKSALDNLRELIGDDQDAMRELIDSFLDDGPNLLSMMQSGLESGDATTVRRAAHSMKSSSRDFGILHVSDLSAALETQCKQNDLTEAASHISEIKAAYKSGVSELETAVAKIEIK